MNRLLLNGRLGRDAQVRGAVDRPIVTFSLAVNAPMAGGERDTQWFTCTAFGTIAKRLVQDLPKKGTQISVAGKIKRKTFVDGQGVERSDVELNVEEFYPGPFTKVFLVGRIVRDAHVSEDIVTFNVMTTSSDENGYPVPSININCEAVGRLGRFLSGALPKQNALVWLEGVLKTSETGYKLIVDHFQFLERKGDGETQQSVGGGRGAYVEDLTARAPHDIWR